MTGPLADLLYRSAIELSIGGRTADRHPFWTLCAGAAATIGVSVALALLATALR